MSYKKQEHLTIREHRGSPPFCATIRVAHLFSFPCCVFTLLFCLSSFCHVTNVVCVSAFFIASSVFSDVYIEYFLLHICVRTLILPLLIQHFLSYFGAVLTVSYFWILISLNMYIVFFFTVSFINMWEHIHKKRHLSKWKYIFTSLIFSYLDFNQGKETNTPLIFFFYC